MLSKEIIEYHEKLKTRKEIDEFLKIIVRWGFNEEPQFQEQINNLLERRLKLPPEK